ncbi:MAG: nucleoside monophosphate kinase [Actinomycetota bacterium]|nr:nucleoside monophosphate kinase [Actinomycetota bacterium]
MTRRILVLGPPAGGKGTHGERLAAELRVPHFATGDMLRQEVAEGTDLGRRARAFMNTGELVPDRIVVAMVVDRISRPDAAVGWVVDGFPRNVHQAQEFDGELGRQGVDLVVALEVSAADILARISGRRTCANGHVYHVEHKPPKKQGVCDVDGEPLLQRDDDTEEVIRHRIEVYDRESRALLEFYESKDVLRVVDGSGDPDQTYVQVRATLPTD